MTITSAANVQKGIKTTNRFSKGDHSTGLKCVQLDLDSRTRVRSPPS